MPKAATISLGDQAKGALRLLAAAIVEGAAAANTLSTGYVAAPTREAPTPEKSQ